MVLVAVNRDSRESLKEVPGLGPKAFEQCAGFLRVPESKDVLDNTAVHPESYKAAESLLSLCGYSGWDLVFFLGVIFGICGSVCLALMWKAPATGYAKAEKIVKELQNKQ